MTRVMAMERTAALPTMAEEVTATGGPPRGALDARTLSKRAQSTGLRVKRGLTLTARRAVTATNPLNRRPRRQHRSPPIDRLQCRRTNRP